VGDLVEEIANGRSRCWVWLQIIGLFGTALIVHARHHGRVTPLSVTSALAVVLLGSISIAPVIIVLQTWAGVYLLTGTLSLFGHLMALRTFDSRTLMRPVDSE
jgi:hypothetical protein